MPHDIEQELDKPVKHFLGKLQEQSRPNGRLVMHDESGEPVAALVFLRTDVAERLHHMDQFVSSESMGLA